MHRWLTLFWIALLLPLTAHVALAETNPAAAAAPAPAPAPEVAAATSHERKETIATLGVTPELAARLTPEQLVELARAHHDVDKDAQLGIIAGIVIPLGIFFFIVTAIGLVQYLSVRREREKQRTLQAMVEKGVAIPPELLVKPTAPPRPDADLRKGLVISGAGLGIVFFFLIFSPGDMPHGLWSIGLIPMFIGGGYLAAYALSRRTARTG